MRLGKEEVKYIVRFTNKISAYLNRTLPLTCYDVDAYWELRTSVNKIQYEAMLNSVHMIGTKVDFVVTSPYKFSKCTLYYTTQANSTKNKRDVTCPYCIRKLTDEIITTGK